jgi:hypothetical protein
MPSRVLPVISSSDESTMAASRALTSSARLRSMMIAAVRPTRLASRKCSGVGARACW